MHAHTKPETALLGVTRRDSWRLACCRELAVTPAFYGCLTASGWGMCFLWHRKWEVKGHHPFLCPALGCLQKCSVIVWITGTVTSLPMRKVCRQGRRARGERGVWNVIILVDSSPERFLVNFEFADEPWGREITFMCNDEDRMPTGYF